MLEREHKYDASTKLVLPDLSGVAGVAEIGDAIEQTLEATYFDTPDHRLTAAGATLRRRTGGDDDGWHLKLPSAVEPDARHACRIGLGRAVRTVPKRFRSTVAGLSGAQDLVPMAIVTTRRTVRRLLDGEEVVLAEVADDHVEALLVTPDEADSTTDTRRSASWREVEVDLVDGEPAVLEGVGKRLAEAGAERTARGSKLAEIMGEPSTGPVGHRAGRPTRCSCSSCTGWQPSWRKLGAATHWFARTFPRACTRCGWPCDGCGRPWPRVDRSSTDP